jgi:hypothetical protein
LQLLLSAFRCRMPGRLRPESCLPFQRNSRVTRSLALAGLLMLPAFLSVAQAESPASVDVSSDIAWLSGVQNTADHTVLQISFPSSSSTIDLGLLPVTADVTAFHRYDDVYRFFSVDITTLVSQGLIYPQDVIAWDGGTYYLAFDRVAAAIPPTTRIDAVSVAPNGLILLSFDTTVQLPGGLTFADEDIAGFDGAIWSMFFDGSAKGIPASLDIDGLDIHPNGSTLYLSFDTSGLLGTAFFNDEDIVSYDGASWSLALDASEVLGASFAAGDLDALGFKSALLFRDGFESPPPP